MTRRLDIAIHRPVLVYALTAAALTAAAVAYLNRQEKIR